MAVCSMQNQEGCVDEGSHASSGECKMLSRVSRSTKFANSVSVWLTVARALRMKKSAPDDYERLCGLEHHLEARKSCQVMQRNKEKVVPVVKELMPEEDISQAEILRCCGILGRHSPNS
jgi:hypothetical protein